MPKLDTNIYPYFDDFDEAKHFYGILIRPRIPVQSRELNQLQSIINNQQQRFGDHIFKQGAIVKDGDINLETNYHYIKVVASGGSDLESETYRETNFQNKIIQGSSGIKALVVNHIPPAGGNVTFYVKYLGSDTTGEDRVFANGETIVVLDAAGSPTAITAALAASAASGKGSAVNIKSGILYARGLFIIFDDQTLILDQYTNTPSYRVGFTISETIITENDDATLNDNAAGFPNFNAPGAHRKKVELTLTKLALGSQGTDDFIELIEVSSGLLTKNKILITEYSELEKTFARRTYDESGDYTRDPFPIDVREFYDSGTNRGIYEPSDFEFDTQLEAKAYSVARFGVTSPGTAHQVAAKWRPGATGADLILLMKAKLAVGIDPGKAYVRGFEIKTLARQYIDANKARTYDSKNNATIKTNIGNYIRITNIYGSPDFKNFDKIQLHDKFTATRGTSVASQIGTARVRGIVYEQGTVGATSAIYTLYLFDIQMNTGKFFYNTKQLYISGFTADIVPTYAQLDGTISVAYNATAVTGVGTLWKDGDSQALVAGDYIATINKASATKFLRVDTTPTSNTALTLTAAPGGASAADDVVGSAFYYLFCNLFEPQNAILVFPLPQQFIKTVTSDGITVDTNYTVQRYFPAVGVNGSGEAEILTSHVDEVFLEYDADDWFVVYTAGSNAGTVYAMSSSTLTLSSGDNTATITGLDPAGSAEVSIVASIRKAQGTPSTAKTKTLNSAATITVTTDSGLNEISLGKADIIRINSIYMSPDFSTAATTGHTDITDRYTLDNGQRDEFYDIGKIIRKNDYPKPTGRLLINFDYYTHGVNGNYFSVDTYSVIGSLQYEDIPQYTSKNMGGTYDLRDCLDFRPRIKDDGTGYANTAGSSLSEIPKGGSVFADFQYYLNRVDKLYLSQKGEFHVIEGITGVNPPPPEDPSDGMVINQLNVRAYTVSTKDVIVDQRDNRRYTMADIGKLERRIANLEYYTSLSLLEKDTADLLIPDDNGLDRFKNGFIVDNFKGHGVGDTLSDDYRCAIDMTNGRCRPMYWSDAVNLVEQDTTTEQRVIDHYAVTNDIVTLPYEEVTMIDQPVASNTINVNPYAVVVFIGDVGLNPPNDEWKDTERNPDLVVNHEGNFDSISQVVNGIGTIWNEWQTFWVGEPKVTQEKTVIGTEVSEVSMPHQDPQNLTRLQKGRKNVWMSRPGIDPWPHREIINTRTITTVDSKQSREGVQGRVIPKVITEDLGDKVVSVAYIPYVRSRDVEFRATGMMPSTKLYPFFDGVDVSGYCTKWAAPGTPEAFDAGDLVSTGTPLITDVTGKVSGTFRVPNSDTLRFQTGERIFKLSSNVDGSDQDADSFGTATYRAQGLLETKQKTILSTRNAEVAWETVVEERLVTDTSISDTTEKGPWMDPISETFLVEDEGGAFLTSIDLFFSAKDLNIPITVEIRETVNGYPGQNVLPFSRVTLDASAVNISADATSETNFPFKAPVYVKKGQEYCFVALTNSNKYKAWIATMGQPKVGTELPILDQPYNGSFFKSQNASTWTADQTVDLKFKLYKAEFDISTVGVVLFNNDALPLVNLEGSPFFTRTGETKIRVFHQNHGFRSDGSTKSKVTISGVTAAVNGVAFASINGSHDILSCDLDSYVIETGSAATSTGRGGSTVVYATENRQMDVVMPVVQSIVLPGTDIKYSIKATSSKSVHPGSGGDSLYVTDTSFTPVVVNDNYEFTSPKLVASTENETTHLTGDKSFFMKALLTSNNANISPVLDLQRLSLITIANRIDDASPTTTDETAFNDTDVDYNTILAASANVVFTAAVLTGDDITTKAKITSTNATVYNALSQLQAGKSIVVTGTTNNNKTFTIAKVTFVSGASITIEVYDNTVVTESPGSTTLKQLERYVDERAPKGGSATSKYQTKRMVLAQVSNGLRITLAVIKPASVTIYIYYKISKVDDPTPMDDLSWEVMEVDGTSGDSTNNRDFRDYNFTLNGLPDFNASQAKVVMRGTNTCEVPELKDLRLIALGT